MAVLTETLHDGAYIVQEAPGFYSRDAVNVAADAALVSGTVLGVIGVAASETASAAAIAPITGNGTLTLDPSAPVAPAAIDGIYEIIFRSATTFEVQAPNGVIVGEGATGVTYNGPLKFVIAAGATAYAAGDRYAVTVARPAITADKWGPLDLTQTNGMQIAKGILFGKIGLTSVSAGTTVKRTITARVSEVRLSNLTWQAAMTAAQLLEAQNQLRAVGIICR